MTARRIVPVAMALAALAIPSPASSAPSGGADASLALAANAAAAVIWTPIESGTTSTITAIEYQGEGRFWFTTGNGQIYKRQPNGTFSPRLPSPTGQPFNDIEFQSGGTVGLAVGNAGQVYRSTDSGDSWTQVPAGGIGVSNEGDGTGNKCTANVPLGDVHFVRFAGVNRVWIGAGARQLARSTPPTASDIGAPGTWVDANRKSPPVALDNCYLTHSDPLADIAFGTPDTAYFAHGTTGLVEFTSDNLSTEAAQKVGSAAAGLTVNGTLAIDPTNPGRLWSVCGGCPNGNPATNYTEDGFNTSNKINVVGGYGFTDGPYDVDFAGGTVLEAGNAGQIINSVNGRDFTLQRAGGDLAAQDWRAVGLADATHGAVGGTNGKLVITATANLLADPGQSKVTPTLPKKSKPPISGGGAKLAGTFFVIKVNGLLGLPVGVDAAAACQGKISVSVLKGKKSLAGKKAKLKPSCKFKGAVKVSSSKVGSAKTLKLKIAFKGNAVLAPVGSTYKIHVKR